MVEVSEHAQEPWSLNPLGTCAMGVGIESEDDSVVSVTCFDCQGDDERLTEANARRIVACVNACAGISTEALECRANGEVKLALLEWI